MLQDYLTFKRIEALLTDAVNCWRENFCWRNFFNFSSFCKLIFFYLVIVFYIIIIDFDFSPNFWTNLVTGKKPSYKIAVYSVKDRVGEGMTYRRMLNVAREFGWDYSASRFPESMTDYWLTRHFYYSAASIINYLYKPKFNFAVTHHVRVIPYGYNITYLNMPTSSLYGFDGKFKPEWDHLTEYDAYADIHSYVHGSNPVLLEALQIYNLPNKKIIPLYIAQDETPYSKANYETIIMTGTLWGCNRGSIRMTNALKRLAKEDLLVAYGVKDYFGFLGKAYKGMIENFGDIEPAMIKLQKQHGIALVIHTLEHMLEGIPTSRISEAAAAGTVIISDNDYFVKNSFGDNVLYIDTLKSTEEIYQQIKNHINWIKVHPEAAEAKARAAHKIFTEKLSIQKQLKQLVIEIEKV